MKAKTYEQMSKVELIACNRAKDLIIEKANNTNAELMNDFRQEQENVLKLNDFLRRERSERNNYFEAFTKTLNIASILAQKVAES